jgi:3',5'-cyclic AMP phosphodiesterase CpdA
MEIHPPSKVLSSALFLALLGVPVDARHRNSARHDARHEEGQAGNPRFSTSRPNPLVLPLPDEKDAFFFVVFGDRTSGPPEGIKVLAQAVTDVNLLAPDLVMTVGDLVQGYNDTPAWLAQAKEYKDTMDRLDCPWFPVVGNHDIYWRGRGAKPQGEHEKDFETHFGPLWYAFEHKNSWFIALDSDEGDPATGKYAFDVPSAQRMSPAQFEWLAQTLARAKQAENIFVFLHHPRWLRGGYGDDWARVHALLAKNGNVKAVFAGHIHRMRYDGVADGIEYFTLATVGGDQSGFASAAGYLHQYDIVTVRAGKIAVASYPVGAAQDPRAITGQVSDEVAALSQSLVTPRFKGSAAFASDLSVSGDVELTIANPTSRPIEVTATSDSRDSRWLFAPDHEHRVVKPGQSAKLRVALRRPPGVVDASYYEPKVSLHVEYLAEALRIPLIDREWTLPVDARTLPAPSVPATEHVLALDGKGDCLLIPSEQLGLPDGPLTLEGWIEAKSFGTRVGFLNKTEVSELGIFVSNGIPSFSIHLEGRYVNVPAGETPMTTNAWHHVAATFDGAMVRIFVDGALAGEAPGRGRRTPNDLFMMVGADVTKENTPVSFFEGRIDEVRISKVARYTAAFTPQRRFEPDADTLVLLHMDGAIGPWAYDSSGRGAHATRLGDAKFTP